MEFVNNKFSENNFQNNIRILEKNNKQTYGKQYFESERKIPDIYKISDNKDSRITTSQEDLFAGVKNNENQILTQTSSGNQNIYKKKIDSIMFNYEKEKEIKNSEIKELSIKLQNILNGIEQETRNISEQEIKKEEVNKQIIGLSADNQIMIKRIEEKLETFEQIQKLNRSEIKEFDLNQEVGNLEKKFDDMVNNWEEYSSEAKSRIEELKNSIEVKKKEYNFKYDKISSLKKEIDEISSKIVMKQEVANFLNDEYQKIPMDINRNKFITKISEITQNIFLEKNNVSVILNELRQSENQIVSMNETIKRVDNELEDKLYQVNI